MVWLQTFTGLRGGRVIRKPVSEILHQFYSEIERGELLKVMEPRINKVKSPVNRLIEDTIYVGRRETERIYLKSFNSDSPYLI